MFNKEIQEKVSEKIEYDLYLLREYLIIYLNLFLFFPNSLEARVSFTQFLKNYYQYSYLEYQILRKIKKTKDNLELSDLCLDMLEDLEKVFYKQFNYNEYILKTYEDAILMNDLNRARVLKPEFKMITKKEKEEFIKKLTLK